MHIANEIINKFDANNHGIESDLHLITDPNWSLILAYFKDTPREERVLKMINDRLNDQFDYAFNNINVTYDAIIDGFVFTCYYQ